MERRRCASYHDEITRLLDEAVRTEKTVEFEKVRCAELERKLAEGVSYIRSFED